MENYLLNEIKAMEGSLLGIGIENEKIKTAINNNDKITIANLLEEPTKGTNKKKLISGKKQRKVNIKKIKKTFRKKRTNYVICNVNTIIKFSKTFVRDSIYINKNKLYIYGQKEQLEFLKKKYERYTTDIELIDKKDKSILVINNQNTKNNKIKDICYWWADTGEALLDFMTIILAN